MILNVKRLKKIIFYNLICKLNFILAGSSEDKLRLFIIYYLCTNNVSQAELDQYLLQLQSMNCDIECIKFLKRYKSISKMNYSNQYNDSSSSSTVK